MFLQPWQIFAGGCVCGSFITIIVLISIFVRIITKHGVSVHQLNIEDTEEEDNG